MINSELLKEAIADAKAVRATSLANAKAALEEAFAPRFEAMFADKLKEEAEEEQEESIQEVEAPNQVTGKGGEAKAPKTKAVSKGNPKTPKGGAGDKDFKAVQAGMGPAGVPKLGKKVNETSEEEGEEKLDEAGLTSEDLDEIIKELENEVAGEEEGHDEMPQAPAPAPVAGDEEGGEVPQSPEFGGEAPEVEADPAAGGEVNIDLGGGEEGGEHEEGGMNAGGLPDANAEGGQFGAQQIPGQSPAPQIPGQPGEDDENINLEELLAALNEEADEEDEEKEVSEGNLPPWLKKKGEGKDDEEDDKEVDESVSNHGVPTNVDGQNKISGTNVYAKAPDASRKQIKGKNHNISGAGNIGTGAVGGKPVSEMTQYKTALQESYKTIEFLRGQINEVNLLNAKLLYTNKLFKEFAGVLDDTYRMKIVESFDLTKNVREVKLAYALLAESLNFGTQITKARGLAQSKVAVQTKGSVKQITEGFASKPVSSTKPSQLITEGNVMALRFKKLAGIKETPKNASNKK